MSARPMVDVGNYPAVQRHYQFCDMHNGSWYLEIIGTNQPNLFIMQEVRNGKIVRRCANPMTFKECLELFWPRTHKMSLEAGNESLPPPMPNVDWK